MEIPLEHFLYLSAILFCIGLYAALTARNLIIVLIGIELMINAALINLASFGRYDQADADGTSFALFAIVLAAASITLALAIVIKVYKHFQSIDPNVPKEMKN